MAFTFDPDGAQPLLTFDGTVSPVREGPLTLRTQELEFAGVNGTSLLALGTGKRELIVDSFWMMHANYTTMQKVRDGKHAIEKYLGLQGALSDGVNDPWKNVVFVRMDELTAPLPRTGTVLAGSAFYMIASLLFVQLKAN